jgi:hypothetical protein
MARQPASVSTDTLLQLIGAKEVECFLLRQQLEAIQRQQDRGQPPDLEGQTPINNPKPEQETPN